jgi:hypothetical protein
MKLAHQVGVYSSKTGAKLLAEIAIKSLDETRVGAGVGSLVNW